MQVNLANKTVHFDREDLHFVEKFGVLSATDMVLDFASASDLPFIYDTYQLASHFGLNRRELFRLVRECNALYRPLILKKKNGGKRIIHVPNYFLRYAQSCILRQILEKLPISNYATAYHRAAKLTDNAAPHCKKRYLLKLDLQNFFGSIRFEQVYSAAFNTHYFPKQIGTMLTTLCCREDVLPQGTPTSPALSNLVMRHFDDVMGAWCDKQGFSYTRYCDDITISGDRPLYVAYVKAKAMLDSMGFELNEKKTHFVQSGNRQTVTGLTVNEIPRVPVDYRRRLRQEIYYVLKYGAADAILRAARTDYIEDGKPLPLKYLCHLVGQTAYVLQTETEASWFETAMYNLQLQVAQYTES